MNRYRLLWCALLYNQFNLLRNKISPFFLSFHYLKRSSKSSNNHHQQVFQLLILRMDRGEGERKKEEKIRFSVRNFSLNNTREKIDVIVVCLSYYDAYQLCTSYISYRGIKAIQWSFVWAVFVEFIMCLFTIHLITFLLSML